MNKTFIIKRLILFLVAIGSVGLFGFIMFQFLSDTKASGTAVGFVFSPSKTTVTVGDTIVMTVSMTIPNKNEKISAIKLQLNTPNFEFVSAKDTLGYFNEATLPFYQSGKGKISGIYVRNRASSKLSQVATFAFTLKAVTAGSVQISVDRLNSMVVGVTTSTSVKDFTIPTDTSKITSSSIVITNPSIAISPTPVMMDGMYTCNYSVNPARLCPSGYTCYSYTSLAGADGVCGNKCYSDSNCKSYETCNFVEDDCPTGVSCSTVMSGYCKLKSCNLTKNTCGTDAYCKTVSVNAEKEICSNGICTMIVGGETGVCWPNTTTATVIPTSIIPTKVVTVTPTCIPVVAPAGVTCESTCGTNIVFKWSKPTVLPAGYIIRNASQTVLGKVAGTNTSFVYNWCSNHRSNTYTISAYNSCGESPTQLNCICDACRLGATPTLIPTPPSNNVDLYFKVKMPNVSENIEVVPNVQVEIMNGSELLLSTYIRLKRTDDGYFQVQSPIRLNMEHMSQKQMNTTVYVKQTKTIRRAFTNVIFTKGKVIDCISAKSASCGGFISQINSRQLYAGDTNGFDTTNPSYNVIDTVDQEKLMETYNTNATDADFNLDGKTDSLDMVIFGSNFGKKGE